MIPLKLYAYAAIVVVALCALAYYRHTLIAEGEARVIAADRVAVEKQAEAVAAAEKTWAVRLQNARESHDAETAALLVPTPVHHIVCNSPGPRPVPGPQGVPASGSPPAGVVQQDAGLHPDIGPALDVLLRRADKLSSDARELNALTH